MWVTYYLYYNTVTVTTFALWLRLSLLWQNEWKKENHHRFARQVLRLHFCLISGFCYAKKFLVITSWICWMIKKNYREREGGELKVSTEDSKIIRKVVNSVPRTRVIWVQMLTKHMFGNATLKICLKCFPPLPLTPLFYIYFVIHWMTGLFS